MSRGFPSMTALLGLLAIAGSRTGISSLKCSAVRYRRVEAEGHPANNPASKAVSEACSNSSRAPASAVYSAEGLVSSSTASNRLAKGMLPILGSGLALTSPLPQTISSRRLGRM